jgi:hypothetical protein
MADSVNLNIDAGATFSVEFAYTNNDGSIFDLTGFTAKMQLRDQPTAATVVLEITPTLTIATGIIGVSISAAQTAALTNSRYVYAIELYGAGGLTIRPVEGYINVSAEVVR